MSTTVTVVCYKSKVLSNNESPLMMRVTKDRKRKYVSLGISVNPEHWDFLKNQPKTECPNREYIELLIADKIKKYSAKIIELNATNQEFTSTTLVEEVCVNRVNRKTVDYLIKDHMNRLETSGRRNYAISIKQLYNSLIEFNHHLDIPFSEIDIAWLRRYESHLRAKGLAENTIGIRFRTLRSIYNVAIDENMVFPDLYPFNKYKVPKLHQETAKRSLTKEDVERVLNFKTTNQYMRFPIDLLAFTYYFGGINFVDIANLTMANIIDGKLNYRRQKTKKLIKIPLQPQAIDIIRKYHNNESSYLFPILSSFHKTDVQKANRIHKAISKVNRRLKEIGEALNLNIDLTTYVARHSQATVMKRAGVSTAVIREIMGHSSERVTQIYLDSFDNEQVDNAMKSLL